MGDFLARLNAILNGSSAVLLFLGWCAIRRHHKDWHRRFMVSAFGVSVVFLISYLTRFYLTGPHRFPHEGWIRIVYFSILLTHTTLAVCVPFLSIRTLYLALKQRWAAHRRLARVTFPVWMYVSVTGVVVYLMLYCY